jgi:pimeloyl-ACP methyl ester carboxylesterase
MYEGLRGGCSVAVGHRELRALFTDVDGIPTRYFEAGDPAAPPLILIHGDDFNYREVASASEWLVIFTRLARPFT